MVSKILVLGASGRTGQFVVEAAVRRNLSVVALVRNAAKFTASFPTNPLIKVVQGSPTSLPDVSSALDGCDGVVSALAIERASDMPWAALVAPPDLLSSSARVVLEAMAAHPTARRLVLVSSWGVADDKPKTPWFFRLVLDWTRLGAVFVDHDRTDALVRGSTGVQWTLARPVGFGGKDDGRAVQEYEDSTQLPGLRMIHRRAVAEWVVAALDDSRTIHKSPVIAQN